MAMKCEEAEYLLSDYMDATLELSKIEALERHLKGCERCQDVHDQFRQLHEEMGIAGEEMPDDSLRENFYHMLQGEINKQTESETRSKHVRQLYLRLPLMRIAAAVTLLLTGAFAGYLVNRVVLHSRQNNQIAELKEELQSMKQLMMLSMLKEESPSQRIQAVSYADDMQAADQNILNALILTLNTDGNVNVRMAAAYSLARYAERSSVRDSLVQSLSLQTEPILQVVLMNILVENKVSSAAQPMQRIIRSDKTMKEVKEVAEKGLLQLM